MPRARFAIRFESDEGAWTNDSELGPRRSVAMENVGNLARVMEKRIGDGDVRWAHITLIVERTEEG